MNAATDLQLQCCLLTAEASTNRKACRTHSVADRNPRSRIQPLQIPVFCNDIHGTLLLRRGRVLCRCEECSKRPEGVREFSCTQFEQHSGSGSAKKWKASLRIVPGGVPEIPAGKLLALTKGC